MSGGEAFFLGTDDDVRARLGPTDLIPGPLDAAAAERLRALVQGHADATGSARALALLEDWPASVACFVRLAPGTRASETPTVPAEPAVSVPLPR
jgi:glutamate synthase domain-containing protein 3